MTTSNPSPLDRVEMALAAIAESNAASVARLDRIEQLTESNARAIQAHGEELRTSLAAYREELTSSLATHRVEFRANISDVVDMVAGMANPVAENNAQIEVLIGESRENSKQHQSFLEKFDRVLGEIRALWQRLAS